jgi:hypothetical protein
VKPFSSRLQAALRTKGNNDDRENAAGRRPDEVIHMPHTPSTAHPFADAAVHFIVRREGVGARVGRMAQGMALAAVVLLLAWTGVGLATLLQAPR